MKITGKIFFLLKNRKMIKGYKKMAKINQELSFEGVIPDNEALTNYMDFIVESEHNDSQEGRYILR